MSKKIISLVALIFVINLSFSYGDTLPKDRLKELKTIQRNIWLFTVDLEKKKSTIKNKGLSKKEKSRIKQKIEKIEKNIEESQHYFLEKASDIPIAVPQKINKNTSTRNLSRDVRDLLGPFIDTLKRISERPRLIEKYEIEIEHIEKNISQRSKALGKIEILIKKPFYNDVSSSLRHSKRSLTKDVKNLAFELERKNRSLSRENGENLSLFDVARDFSSSFVKTKGKNLIITIFVFMSMFWSLMVLRRKIFALGLFHEKLKFFEKPLRALYSGITFSISTLGAIFCLYLLNDWILITVSLLIITGLLWSSKQFLPKIIDEARLIFNLGTVREGERIIWKNIPWVVTKLGLYSTLKNESLQGGEVQVAASELLNYHSRKFAAHEPWFPTHKHEWVILNDGVFGKIILQTPEQVIVEKLGGSHKYYSAAEFISEQPENLSKGFRIEVTFGLDYGLQQDIIKRHIISFQEKMTNRLNSQKELNGKINQIFVEYNDSGESSMNLWVGVDFRGATAPIYPWAKRKIEEFLVEICNEESLTIPFNQLTVHLNDRVKI